MTPRSPQILFYTAGYQMIKERRAGALRDMKIKTNEAKEESIFKTL